MQKPLRQLTIKPYQKTSKAHDRYCAYVYIVACDIMRYIIYDIIDIVLVQPPEDSGWTGRMFVFFHYVAPKCMNNSYSIVIVIVTYI